MPHVDVERGEIDSDRARQPVCTGRLSKRAAAWEDRLQLAKRIERIDSSSIRDAKQQISEPSTVYISRARRHSGKGDDLVCNGIAENGNGRIEGYKFPSIG